jgi:hypothetical protein
MAAKAAAYKNTLPSMGFQANPCSWMGMGFSQSISVCMHPSEAVAFYKNAHPGQVGMGQYLGWPLSTVGNHPPFIILGRGKAVQQNDEHKAVV